MYGRFKGVLYSLDMRVYLVSLWFTPNVGTFCLNLARVVVEVGWDFIYFLH
jgi:hypothetical protein